MTNPKAKSVDDIRHTEYYGLQETFDGLYAKSKDSEIFTNLMDVVLSRENILLAYRNIKANRGSKTPGTDGSTIDDIGKRKPDDVVEKVRFAVTGKYGYNPKPVRRKEIPKPNGSTRPLGIPCMWDRLIQQCIKQVMEPICEAKFSNNSYGFRPERSAEHAIARSYFLMNMTKLHYVVEFDIKGFFDNVNHQKLMRQIWAMGIRDKQLLYVISRILKAPIKLPQGGLFHPTKGTPQGGIISPLLANICLNELDRWVESNWENSPVTANYATQIKKNGSSDRTNAYAAMKKTKLKEMYIVRYADDFRIFCRTKSQAEKVRIAVMDWLSQRLHLEISPEKTKVVNLKRRYSEFLGFKMKVHKKGKKVVVTSHICDKALKRMRNELVKQAKRIARPRTKCKEQGEIRLYNEKVMGMQNYYCIATNVNIDCSSLQWAVNIVLKNRLGTQRKGRLRKQGRKLTDAERKRYGKSQMMRYVAGSEEPIYPIGYVQCKNPMNRKRSINRYTPEGRAEIHDNLRINTGLMLQLMRKSFYNTNTEYSDNRISLFSAQWGKCAVTGREFQTTEEIHCHHRVPKSKGGTDKYENLVLVLEPVHRLIHATSEETIKTYMEVINPDKKMLNKINHLREQVGNDKIII
jgi:group II intron reverse transcriptase/maturase